MDHALPKDLTVFLAVASRLGFAAAANDLGMSSAFVSKRIAILEEMLGCRLLVRSSRNVQLTRQGKVAVLRAREILSAYQDLRSDIEGPDGEPGGDLRVTASAAMGRTFIAPVLAELARSCPQLTIRLEIVDHRVSLVTDRVDIDIRVGGEHADSEIVHHLASGRRILCAAPTYLDRFGTPDSLGDLAAHQCLLIRERAEPFGRWSLEEEGRDHSVQITSVLSSNDGAVVRRWALAGHGIMLRSYWDVARNIARGELRHILPHVYQTADVAAVTLVRSSQSLRVRRCLEHLRKAFAEGALKLPLPLCENAE